MIWGYSVYKLGDELTRPKKSKKRFIHLAKARRRFRQRRVGSIFPKGRNYNGLSQSDPHPCIRIGRIGESKSIPYILILQNRIEPELIS